MRGFLPSTGRLVRYAAAPCRRWRRRCPCPVPEEGGAIGGVRVDTGVYAGGEIPMYYDSMIAKLIVHGRDRAGGDLPRCARRSTPSSSAASAAMCPFQAALLAHPKFVAGDFNTGFIAEHYGRGFTSAEDVPHDDPLFLVALAAAAFVRRKARERASRHQRPARRPPREEPARTSWSWCSGREAAYSNTYVPVRIDEFDPSITARPMWCIEGRHFAIQSD